MSKNYIFILGRNPKLSFEEIKSYFEKTGNKILKSELKSHAVFLELSEEFKKGEIENLGGVIAVIEIVASGNIKELIRKLEDEMIYAGEENKLNYVLWDFAEDFSGDILDYLKQRFKSEKLKATLKHLSEKMELQTGEEVGVVSSGKLIDEEYCVFQTSDKDLHFGKIFQKINYKDIEKRDMSKPVRRPELSISPRLAKIMINLSQVNPGETFLDPFCGIGVLLQEALLQGIPVIGIDLNREAIQDAGKNLSWGKFPKENYKLISGDSRTSKLDGEISGIATEPDLGKILRKLPTKAEAEKTLKNFESLIINVVNNFKGNVKGKIVFSSPCIKTISKRVSVNSEELEKKTNLKISEGFPIQDFRKDQIVGREIFVLEKKA